MADKMMRIAGRGTDGLAKAISTDKSGRLDVRVNKKIQLTAPRAINAGAELIFGPYNTDEKYSYATFNFDTRFEMKVYIAYHYWNPPTNAYVAGDYEEVLSSTSVSDRYSKAEVKLKTSRFSVKVHNYGGFGGFLGENSFIILSDFEMSLGDTFRDIYSNSSNLKRQIVEGGTVAVGGFKRSLVKSNRGYNHATLKIPKEFPMKVSIRYFYTRSNGVNSATSYREIAESTQVKGEFLSLEVPLETDQYQILIDNIGTTVAHLSDDNFEILSNVHELERVQTQSLLHGPISRPKSRLYFRQTAPSIAVMTRAEDGVFYVADQDGLLKKYTNIVKQGESPTETGLNFYTAIGKTKETANLVAIRVLGNDINYFANVDNKATIYHTKSINTAPTRVYQSADEGALFSKSFGIDAYLNGIATTRSGIVLASAYGTGQIARDLVVSTDRGVTFKVVKKTQNLTSVNGNSHWHDVAYDAYRGWIWASEGDGANSAVWYSEDLGASWKKLPDKEQPTAIVPFSDRIVFGRDGWHAGVDVLEIPDSQSYAFGSIKPLKDANRAMGANYFARKPVTYSDESYMSFEVYESVSHPSIVIATGDGGRSWHGVWSGVTNIGNFIAMDDENVYAYDKWGASVVYSKRVLWS